MPGLLGGRREMEKELQKDSPKTHLMIEAKIAPFYDSTLKKEGCK